jgi:hypothetical protein
LSASILWRFRNGAVNWTEPDSLSIISCGRAGNAACQMSRGINYAMHLGIFHIFIDDGFLLFNRSFLATAGSGFTAAKISLQNPIRITPPFSV